MIELMDCAMSELWAPDAVGKAVEKKTRSCVTVEMELQQGTGANAIKQCQSGKMLTVEKANVSALRHFVGHILIKRCFSELR